MNSTRIFPPLTSTPFGFQTEPVTEKPVVTAATTAVEDIVITPMKMPVTEKDAENAVRTLLEWIGEDANREGLKETPTRLTRAWKEFFKGLKEDPRSHFKHTSLNTDGYNDMVCLTPVSLKSFCEKTLMPIEAQAYIAYIPAEKIADATDIRAMADATAGRLQTQEKLTRQIATAIQDRIQPKGVIVALRSDRMTMATFGTFETDTVKRAEFLAIVNR